MHTKPSRSIAFAGGALLVGLIVGYIIGRQSDVSPSSISSAVVKSGDQATSSERAVEEGALIDGNSGAQRARTRGLWANQVADLYAKVEPGKPTPGFATLFKEAIDRGEPYSQGSVLMIIEGMRAEDLPQAFSLMKRAGQQGKFRGAPGTGQQSMVWQAFWNRFGELDPANALTEVRNLGDIDYFGKEFAEKNIFHGWALHDPAAAAQGFLDRTDLLKPGFAVRGVTYEWGMVDLPAVTRWANDHLSGELRAEAFCSVAYAVVHREGFKQGVTWWQQLTDEASRKMVFASLQDMANRRGQALSVEDRVAMITSGLDLGLRDERMEVDVAGKFAGLDPAAGAELFTKFPATGDPNRFNALNTLLANWTRKDVTSAGEWVKQQQGERWYDSAAAGFAVALGEREPATAESWAATIQDERLRQQTLAAIARTNQSQPKP